MNVTERFLLVLSTLKSTFALTGIIVVGKSLILGLKIGCIGGE